MEALGDLLPKALRKHVARAEQPVLDLLIPLWPRAVGKHIGRFSRPAAFENGVLTILASSSAWATQIKGLTDPICARINDCLGVPVVKRLRVREDRSGKFGFGPALQATGRAPAAPPPDAAAEAKRLWLRSEVTLAPDLAEVVERSFVKYFSRAAGRSGQ